VRDPDLAFDVDVPGDLDALDALGALRDLGPVPVAAADGPGTS
jgi:hypothetical protein